MSFTVEELINELKKVDDQNCRVRVSVMGRNVDIESMFINSRTGAPVLTVEVVTS